MSLVFLAEFASHAASAVVIPTAPPFSEGGVASYAVNDRTRWVIQYRSDDGELRHYTITDVTNGLELRVPYPDRVADPLVQHVTTELRRAANLR